MLCAPPAAAVPLAILASLAVAAGCNLPLESSSAALLDPPHDDSAPRLDDVELEAEDVVLGDEQTVTYHDLGPLSDVRGRVIVNDDGFYTVFVCEEGQVRRRADFEPDLEMFTDWCEIDLQPASNGGLEYVTVDEYRGDPLGCAECPYWDKGEFSRCRTFTVFCMTHHLIWDSAGRLTSSSEIFDLDNYGWGESEHYEYSGWRRVTATSRSEYNWTDMSGRGRSTETKRWTYCPHGIRRVQTETECLNNSYGFLCDGREVHSLTADWYVYEGFDLAYIMRDQSGLRWSGNGEIPEHTFSIVEDPESEYPPDLTGRHLDAYCAEYIPQVFLDKTYEPPGDGP